MSLPEYCVRAKEANKEKREFLSIGVSTSLLTGREPSRLSRLSSRLVERPVDSANETFDGL